MQHPASPVGVNISSSIYINLTHTSCTLCTLVYLKVPSLDAGDSKQSWNSTPNPLSPQKGSLVNLSDTLYAMSSMDLRSRYIRKFGRVPLHLNYKLLGIKMLFWYLYKPLYWRILCPATLFFPALHVQKTNEQIPAYQHQCMLLLKYIYIMFLIFCCRKNNLFSSYFSKVQEPNWR